MPKSNNWKNHGSNNPRKDGGIFIRYDPNHELYEILQTTSTEDFDGFDFSYFFEHAYVEKSLLLEDNGLQKFAGLKPISPGILTEKEILLLAIAYIQYYGSDQTGYETNNYWGELKTYGIYASILKK